MARKQRNSNGKFRNSDPNNQYGYSGNNYPNNQFGDFGTDFSNGRIYDKQYGEVKKSNKGSILIGFLIGLLVMGGIGAGVLFFLNIGSNKNVTPVGSIPVDVSVGDIITFGKYEQDNDLTNGAEPIEWNVLDVQDGKALLISKYILFASDFTDGAMPTWSASDLRWDLNEYWFNEVFTPEEANKVLVTIVHTDNDSKYTEDQGEETEDRLFILSASEADKYFDSNKARVCEVTERTAENDDIYMEEGIRSISWWTRTRAANTESEYGTHKNMVTVSYFGHIYEKGSFIGFAPYGVRPALWINLAS